MPEMKSPDGNETLFIPDTGVQSLTALGWSIVGSRHTTQAATESAPADEEPAKRGPGRPRKRE